MDHDFVGKDLSRFWVPPEPDPPVGADEIVDLQVVRARYDAVRRGNHVHDAVPKLLVKGVHALLVGEIELPLPGIRVSPKLALKDLGGDGDKLLGRRSSCVRADVYGHGSLYVGYLFKGSQDDICILLCRP